MKRAHDYSGATKRKIKKQQQENAVSNVRPIFTYLKNSQSQSLQDRPTTNEANADHLFIQESDLNENQNAAANSNRQAASGDLLIPDCNAVKNNNETDITKSISLSPTDPALWHTLSKKDILAIEVTQVENFDFPINNETPRRRFTPNNYYMILKNGEKLRRSWMSYSKMNDSVYCYACIVFGDQKSRSSLSSTSGFGNKWSLLSKGLKEHEESGLHKECMLKWHLNRTSNTVDQLTINRLNEEKKYWKSVLLRLISITQFLAERNLPFRGSIEKLGNPRNGLFLGEVELLAQFDPVLMEHTRRAKNNEIRNHYLSNTIQEELISLLGNATTDVIVERIKNAKYFSIIVDCTPDISHKEQMSVVIRGVQAIEGKGAQIFEHFLKFIEVHDTTGRGLFEEINSLLSKHDISISDCRGQAYDGGSNMSGKTKGVQSRFLDVNPKADFMPCAAHRLNLVISDAAKSSTAAISFFGYVQRLYNIFSSSTKRWDVLKKHVNKLTVKNLPETRWEAKAEAVKALRLQPNEIINALKDLQQSSLENKDGVTMTECKAIVRELSSWRFLVCLVVWHDLLMQINIVSKILQSPNVCFTDQTNHIQSCLKFISNYRDHNLEKAEREAENIADELQIVKEYADVRIRKKTKFFFYEANDDVDEMTGRQHFERTFFYPLMDMAFSSLNTRFEQLSLFESKYAFLSSSSAMTSKIQENSLLEKCKNFENHCGDISAAELFSEIICFTNFKSDEDLTALDILQYLFEHKLVEVYPNFALALRVFLTLPVTVASCERSFSKLKLIKNYLRNSMCQERLTNLAIISIENEICRSIDHSSVLNTFISKKDRLKF